jgi:hypothetical protein
MKPKRTSRSWICRPRSNGAKRAWRRSARPASGWSNASARRTCRVAYRKRKWIAEPPNGWIQNVLGFRQFSMRGLHRVQAEWKLVCMALNLRRMAVLSAR